jgi:ribosomal protein S18 acetylase RimI-like enzyme
MNQTKVTYLSGGIELLDEIQSLWEQLNRHHASVSPHFAADFHAKTFVGRKKALLEKYAAGQMRIDIAQFQGRSIGYLISAITLDGVGEIESIYIEDGFRGQAVGDQLMHRALDWLDACQVHTKVIAVAVGNERAYKFYARYGFYPRVVTLKQRPKVND